ncbi:GNAT family N-acetyltransferase [Kytococcus sedentarius]|uniref:Acetyltransferase (GNAT) family protein n=1 Tax=Kytococcus sedentarius (strain ATCC 14392 / DSM 20547 / JCM 11482 / CCUG 33030 / NBRC 15357 / NCTC 11040 / CCM 314 / 541) TaxID=478801 RepID=C7NFQ2_KYTSD|nr:GNAT family N-acetyltransferase [Kytococcus sedentarius]ACV07410.1 acetyltransferase (GNAT) family protein [Kytococcus sedentarius DSM 20547]QQB63363.1 GNAT family N-acetyltransferase [Kytococcus sedentarius]STX13740.1 putative acetyltransferase [Kytococcus sedentarius]
MTDITVRELAADEWEIFKTLRLRALQEDPEAFVASYEEESQHSDEEWQERMSHATRIGAQRGSEWVALASVGDEDTRDDDDLGEVYGIWVTPSLRGEGVARQLMEHAELVGRNAGYSHLAYWVNTDNGRAVAFASSIGYRPTEGRRDVVVEGQPEVEAAFMIPLGSDTDETPLALQNDVDEDAAESTGDAPD